MPITFVYTYNPNLRFNKTVIENSLLSLSDPVLQKVYEKKKPLITTRQPPNLKKYLTKAKFELNPKIELLENRKQNGLFACTDPRCLIHLRCYLTPCTKFSFISNMKVINWIYRRHFDCSSVNLIYLMKCSGCNEIYIGETSNIRHRINNAKKDIINPMQSSVPYALNIKNCTKLIEPYFKIYPLIFENDSSLRKFKEWRLIKKYNPSLNKKL